MDDDLQPAANEERAPDDERRVLEAQVQERRHCYYPCERACWILRWGSCHRQEFVRSRRSRRVSGSNLCADSYAGAYGIVRRHGTKHPNSILYTISDAFMGLDWWAGE